MKTRNTKKRFVLSLVAVIACVAMLVGTTMAWFTDSVTSGKNKIVAGNLDVELKHYTSNTTAETVKDATDLFKVTLWEPGVVAYENFVVSNEGNLALKYAFNLNVFDKNTYNGKDLTEVIKVAVVNDGFTATGNPATDRAAAQELTFETLADFQKTGKLKAKGTEGLDSDTYGVVLYWEPTDHDNDYNVNNYTGTRPTSDGQPLFVEFGVNLVATQDTVEADSFDNQYDVTAPLAVMSKPITKPLDETETLKIVVPAEAQSSVKEATVPADVANKVFDKVFKGSTATDKSLTLVLNVEEKSKTDTTFNYEIDMDAVIKEITGGEVTKNETKSINELGLSFTDFVEVQMNIEPGLNDVIVKHSGSDMTQVADLATAKAYTPEDEDGYFNYDKANGLTKLWIKSFSPFTVSGTKPEACIIRDGVVIAEYRLLNDALTAVGNGQNDDVVKITSDVTVDYELVVNKKAPVFNITQYTIDLNGHTVSSSNATSVFKVGDGPSVNVTFMDSSEAHTGKVINTYSKYNTGANAIYQNASKGTICIESGTYSGGKSSLYIQDTVVINGGTFNNDNGSGPYSSSACILAEHNSAKVFVNGGKFVPRASGGYWISGKNQNNNPSQITITNGDFAGISREYMFRNTSSTIISITGGNFDFEWD